MLSFFHSLFFIPIQWIIFCDFFLLTSLPFTIEVHVESDRKIVAPTRASSLLNAKATEVISVGGWRELLYQQES